MGQIILLCFLEIIIKKKEWKMGLKMIMLLDLIMEVWLAGKNLTWKIVSVILILVSRANKLS